MSRKTKAELEAELLALQSENEILRDQNDTLLYLSDSYFNEIKHRTAANKKDTREFVTLLNSWMGAVKRLRTGPDKIKDAAAKRNEHLKNRFIAHRKKGCLIGEARDKANADMVKKFKCDPLKKRRLQDLLKD